MRDREFYINSIKMDLYRIVTAVGKDEVNTSTESANEFLNHAIGDFNKFDNTSHDKLIKNKLENLQDTIYKISDPKYRLLWAEDVLTARCRLY